MSSFVRQAYPRDHLIQWKSRLTARSARERYYDVASIDITLLLATPRRLTFHEQLRFGTNTREDRSKEHHAGSYILEILSQVVVLHYTVIELLRLMYVMEATRLTDHP